MQITSAKVSKLVIEAMELNQSIDAAQARVDLIKQAIRDEADKFSKSGEIIRYKTPAGEATVVFPRDAVTIALGANLFELHATIPDVMWNDLFSQETVLAEGFDDKFKRLSPKWKPVVRGFVKWTPRAPRVTLPK